MFFNQRNWVNADPTMSSKYYINREQIESKQHILLLKDFSGVIAESIPKGFKKWNQFYVWY